MRNYLEVQVMTIPTWYVRNDQVLNTPRSGWLTHFRVPLFGARESNVHVWWNTGTRRAAPAYGRHQ